MNSSAHRSNGMGMSVVLGAMKHRGFSKNFCCKLFHLEFSSSNFFLSVLLEERIPSVKFWPKLFISETILGCAKVWKRDWSDFLSALSMIWESLFPLLEVGPVLSSEESLMHFSNLLFILFTMLSNPYLVPVIGPSDATVGVSGDKRKSLWELMRSLEGGVLVV